MRVKFVSTLVAALTTLVCVASAGAEDEGWRLVAQGEAAASTGDWLSASRDFMQAAQAPAWRARASYDLSVADYHLGAIPQALAAVKTALQLNDRFVSAHVQLATILTRTGDYLGAETSLKKALQLDPQSKVARANLDQIRCVYLASRSNQAVHKGVAPAVPKAVIQNKWPVPEAVKSVPVADSLFVAVGQDAMKPQLPLAAVGKFDAPAPKPVSPAFAAVGSVTSDRDSYPSSTSSAGEKLKETATDLVAQAALKFQEGDVNAAEYVLKRAANLDPGNIAVRINQGVIAGARGDFAADATHQREALALAPRQAVAHFNLAWALAQQENWPDSLKEYEAALQLNPRMSDAVAGKSIAMAKLGHVEQAIDLLAQMKETYPRNAWPCVALGRIYLGQQRVREAGSEFKEALAREPESLDAQEQLAQLSLRLKDFRRVVTQCQSTLLAAPYDVDSYLVLACAQQNLQDDGSAVESLRSAIKIAPANALAHAALSHTLERLGRRLEAEEEAKVALKLNPKRDLAESGRGRSVR